MNSASSEAQPLKGQVAVVTGSTQGIGAGIALTLARHGAQIAVHGLEKQRAGGEKVAKSIEEAGSRAILITGDLREEAHCRNVIHRAVAELGRVDILVNNAAVVHRSNLENTTTE